MAITWKADFSSLPLKDLILQAANPSRATLVDSPRTGGKALKLTTLAGDKNVVFSGEMERCDVYQAHPGTGDPVIFRSGTQWWSHSILFPEDFQFPQGSSYVVFDFHNHPEAVGQANFMVNFVNWNGDNSKLGALQLQRFVGTPTAMIEHSVAVLKPERDVWYDFVYHVHWSSKSDGFFTAWVNGKLAMDHTGPTLYTGAGEGVYMKLANYHNSNGQQSSVIHDRVRMGTTLTSVTQ